MLDVILHQFYHTSLKSIFGCLIDIINLQFAKEVFLVGDDGVNAGIAQGCDLLHRLA